MPSIHKHILKTQRSQPHTLLLPSSSLSSSSIESIPDKITDSDVVARLPFVSFSGRCVLLLLVPSATFASALYRRAAARNLASAICSGVSRRPELSIKNVSGHLSRKLRWRLSNSGRMLRPSMCAGVATPPMSRNVGAKSIPNTISSTLFCIRCKLLFFKCGSPRGRNHLHCGRFDARTAN